MYGTKTTLSLFWNPINAMRHRCDIILLWGMKRRLLEDATTLYPNFPVTIGKVANLSYLSCVSCTAKKAVHSQILTVFLICHVSTRIVLSDRTARESVDIMTG
jgi:hypothetical protein